MPDFKLITSDRPRAGIKPQCTVKMGKDVVKFDDFFVVGMHDDTDKATMFYNADAITIGLAVKFASAKFEEEMAKLSEEDRHMVFEALDQY